MGYISGYHNLNRKGELGGGYVLIYSAPSTDRAGAAVGPIAGYVLGAWLWCSRTRFLEERGNYIFQTRNTEAESRLVGPHIKTL